MRASPVGSVIIALSVFHAVHFAWAQVPDRTRALIDARPGVRPVIAEGRLVALFGKPLAVDSDPRTTTDEFVAAFVAQHADALGANNGDLKLKGKAAIRGGKYTVYTYTQRIEGLPVHGSLVKLAVLTGATEKIAGVNMRLVPRPAKPLPGDTRTAADAVSAVTAAPAYRGITTFDQPVKVVYEADDGTLHRVWRFSGSGAGGAYRFFVDTSTANIVAAQNRILDADVGGSVTGDATPGVLIDDLTVQANASGAGALPRRVTGYSPVNWI